ncbi:LuxR family transcriptional regulator [Rhizorhabdus wittichii]|uniref:LuxR family transcriptional regulator n=1 Tax=Rhizorhabdus wittichii TaxID=160791 RepID=A0A975HDC3_9SPHN|nr:helix-turn-helix transcriptional regulator [Rhizorhabdus wittichii]QTH21118.1 LuxR family transcriptional regulator [Rhizorhabdus wittichii]
MDDHGILANLYGASQDRRRLTAALGAIRDVTGARTVTLQWFRRTDERLRTTGFETCLSVPFISSKGGWADFQNPRMLALVNPPSDGISFFEDSACPDFLQPDLRRWQARFIPFGIGRFLGARVNLRPDREVGLALHARHGGPDLPSDARDLLAGLMPHVREALRLIEQAEEKESGARVMANTLALLEQPVAVVRTDGEIVYANEAARRLLAEAGLLSARGPAAAEGERKIAALVGHLLDPKAAPHGCRFTAGGRTLFVQRAWLEGAGEADGGGDGGDRLMMLAFNDHGKAVDICPDRLRTCFDITRSEAELLAALCAGSDIAAFAARRRVSIHTARTQLKQLMAKTDVRRQADLVRMALATPVASLRRTH